MYVVPDSTIILLKGCPLNKNYEHTIYFDSVAEQTSYFMGLAKRTFDKCTYQRELRGRCSLQVNTADIYDCNYMMYQNSAYNNKWFYAFIDRVEWVNNANTNVYFTIDVMQTWFFDYDLQLSFVEREHTVSDEYFEHTIPEELGFGENIVLSTALEEENGFLPDAAIYTATESPGSGAGRIPEKAYGMYFPLYSRTTSINENTGAPNRETWDDEFNSFLQAGKQDAVVSVYAIPRFMCRYFAESETTAPAVPPEDVATHDFNISKNLTLIGEYKPRNKKLFCYPYNFLRITNNAGSAVDYRYEDFSTDVCNFRAYGNAVPNPVVTIVPRYYLGGEELFDCSISLNGYPPIPYTGDVYAAYMAMNRNSLEYAKVAPVEWASFNTMQIAAQSGVDLLGGLFGYGKNGDLTMPLVGGLMGMANSIMSGLRTMERGSMESAMTERKQLAQQADLQQVPNTIHGLSQSASVMVGANRLRPVAYRMGIKPEYAATIDSYFDKYGYKCNETKIPNRNVRPHWTYTKTVGCTINARCPSDDEEAICQIYDRGVTFWRNGSEVGDYSLDNTV